MKAPDKIYIFQDGDDLWYRPEEWKTPPINRVEYIRADLAELTWEDCAGIMDAFFDFMQGITAGRETPRHSKEELYKEVLRRFLESKKEVEL